MLKSSISTRVGAFTAALLTAVGLAAVYVVYQPHQDILAKKELRHLAAASEERAHSVVESIAELREDVQFLAGMGRNLTAEGRMETILVSFLRHRPQYVQVRLVDRRSGLELIRVERPTPDVVAIAAPEDLLKQEDSDYLRAAALLPRGGVLLSEIEVSRGGAATTARPKAIVDAATPVYGADTAPFAVLEISQDLSRLFDGIERSRPLGSDVYLTDSSGGYLLGMAANAASRTDHGHPRRLQDDLPALQGFYRDDDSGDRKFFDSAREVQGANEKFVIHMTKIRFDPARPSRFLALGMYSSYDALLADSSEVGRNSVLTASLLVLFGSVLIFVYVRRLLRPLALVAASSDRVAAGDYDVALPPESDDEIGSLSRSFRIMVHQVRERTLQIEHHKLSLLGINSRLEKARQELEAKTIEQERRAGQDKSEFLARISHDIRTPLNSMLLLANALADNRERNLTAEQEQSAKVLAGAGADLLALVNDLLDLSKLGAGKLQLISEEVDTASLVRHISGQFQPLAAAKGLELRVELHPDLPAAFVTDPRRLRQILWNLLSNALKYTSAGSVTLTARPTESGRIAFKVQDTGDGIPADQLGRIFSPYHQLDRDVRSSTGGTGLGLSIVKELTAAMGGELDVGSQLGEGSWFEVRLAPRARLPKTSENRKESVATDKRDLSKRILLADDDSATRWALTRSLQQADPDAAVDEAETGPEALECIRRQAYQCVILDYHLPLLDGMTVLKELREEPPAVMPQVLLYTGRELEAGERAAAEQLGAIVLPKEGFLDPILKAVRRAFDGRHPVILAGRRLLLAEDDSANSFALSQELIRLGARVERARDGLEAVFTLEARKDIDLVLMDMRMPIMDGYEAISRIRANPLHERLPIIALTADATDADRARCLAAGATSFLSKPIDLQILVQEIVDRTGALASQG